VEAPVNTGVSGDRRAGAEVGFVAGPGDRKDSEDEGLSSLAEGYRKASPYIAASTSLVSAVALFTLGGVWLDRKLGNQVPWFTLLGAALGMTGGFISFFRTVLGKRK
jgi:F0F1-type ATP synthase assembly protein I